MRRDESSKSMLRLCPKISGTLKEMQKLLSVGV